jgi:hypothetical protein
VSDEKVLSNLKAALTELGVSGTSIVDRVIRAGVRLHEIESVVRSAREQYPLPDPCVIFGRIKSLPDNPKLIDAPWPHKIAAVRRLRRADAEHERDKLRRRAAIEAAGETDLTSSLVDVLAEPEIDVLERDVGPLWDRLPAEEQDAFAASVLSEFSYRQWKKGNVSLFREQLFEAYSLYELTVTLKN